MTVDVLVRPLLQVLLLGCLLAGCAYPPATNKSACCTTPAPGTASVRTEGEVVNGWTFWHR